MSLPRAALLLPPLLVLAGLAPAAHGQSMAAPRPQAVSNPVAGSAAVQPVVPESITPTWETQTEARTCYFEIPAPRGQIVDRNGMPLAQSRLGYHLDLSFPSGGAEMTDVQVVNYVKPQLVAAQALLRRPLELSTAEVLEHYKNRRVVPLDLAQYLSTEEVDRLRPLLQAPLSLRPVYLRYYPQGAVAGHLVGYVGKTGGTPHGPLQPNEAMWPNLEGREGLELAFNDALTGKNGSLNLTFDAKGNKTSERVLSAPVPGKTVVTTLDLNLQRMCEDLLAKQGKPGAIVFIDPNNGDVLAMASWPTFDPNLFVPSISTTEFNKLNNDPRNPLIPRAFRASYPAGSTYKVMVGAAALQSRTISPDDTFSGPAQMTIGNIVMHNWKKRDAGDLNFAEALTQSCDTWFYQVGIKTGADKMTDWGKRFGFGTKTGLPVRDEEKGCLPDNEYMRRVHKRRLLDGDLANLSIGQGDLLVTPVQMAQATATVANGGMFYQLRLVKQIQDLNGDITGGYPIQPRRNLGLSEDVMDAIKDGMVGVIEDANGTAHKARVPNVEVAGKTGTAQWGAGNKNRDRQRTAAWFIGFAPADKPKYAFAVCVEGAAGDHSVHGGTAAAPLMGKALRELFKEDSKPKKKVHAKKGRDRDEDRDDDEDDNDSRRGRSNRKSNNDDDDGNADESD